MRFLITALAALIFLASAPSLGAHAQAPPNTGTESAESLLGRARGLFDIHKYKEAIALLDRAIALSPSPRAYVLRGDAKASLDDDRGALTDYDKAIVLAPGYAYAYATRCDTRRTLQDLAGALDDCNRAVQLDATDSTGFKNRGDVYYDLDDNASAIRDYSRAVSIDSEYAGAFVGRCRSYWQTNDAVHGIADCNAAIKLQSRYARAFYWRAMFALTDKRWTDGVADLNTVIEISPSQTGAYYYRGYALHALDKNALAMQDAEAYIKTALDDGDGFRLRGEIRAASQDTSGAIDDFKKAIALYNAKGNIKDANATQVLLDRLQPRA
jgi:tetratricopeptide (TPR) repeat protein